MNKESTNKIEEIHVTLARKGFVIYKKGEQSWAMRKIAMPEDARLLEETPFLSYETALQEATRLKDPPSETIKWSVLLRYNRGLGPEAQSLDYVDAGSHTEAQNMAEELALGFFARTPGMDKAKIIEVRTHPCI
jgi:hypothetical protein